MKKVSKKQKKLLCYLGLLVIFILMGNSNNVPDMFAERIFKPIRGDSWRISYSGLIIIVGIYYCLKYLNEIKENSLIKTVSRRIVATILLMFIFTAIWSYPIKFYKGFSKDLNSIYFDREKSLVNFNGTEGKVTVNGSINIKNCSNSMQRFYIKIKTPFLVKDDIKEDYIALKNEIILNGREETTLYIDEELKYNRIFKYSGYSTKAYEYIIFNDEDEAIFKGSVDDYRLDEHISKNGI